MKHLGFWGPASKLMGLTKSLEPINLLNFRRRRSPNDALIAPPNVFPDLPLDAQSPVLDASLAVLAQRLGTFANAQERLEVLPNVSQHHYRFIQRTALLRYPDEIDVLLVPVDEAHSTYILYSRSAVGRRDFGVNLNRLTHWSQQLQKAGA